MAVHDGSFFVRALGALQRSADTGLLGAEVALLRQVVEDAPIVFWAVDADGVFTISEGRALASLGLAPGEAVGQSVWDLFGGNPQIVESVRAALAGETRSDVVQVGEATFSASYAPLQGGQGEVVGAVGVATDISGTARAEARWRGLLDTAQDPIALADGAGVIEHANFNAQLALGWSEDDLIGRPVAELFPGRLQAHIDEMRRAALETGAPQMLTNEEGAAAVTRAGDELPIDLVLTLLPGNGEPRVSCVLRDAGERLRAQAQLQQLIDFDPFTGLYTRRRFEQELERQVALNVRYGHSGGVLVVDLDRLLVVNEQFGRSIGDELILAVSKVLTERTRETDTIGRVGGDSFAVILPECDSGQAMAVAIGLRDAVREAVVETDTRTVRTTASIGVAPFGGDAITADELLATAEMAAREGKESGGDRVSVHSRDSTRAEVARLSWVERIREAIATESFAAYGQPILDLKTGEISQWELLVRMIDRDGGIIAPDEFLAVAERYGLVQAIDRWMVTQAIRLIAAEAAQGRKLTLEVNLSGRSVDDPALPVLLERELRESGIDPSHLIFEITETAAIANMDDARRFADSMTALGCRFALDDFGTGFGSFVYLKRLPLHYLKIDGDFIRALPRSQTDQLVAKALVQIAEGLGVKTVAEYVGDEETCRLLRQYGVDFAQGYHVGRPRPLADFLAA